MNTHTHRMCTSQVVWKCKQVYLLQFHTDAMEPGGNAWLPLSERAPFSDPLFASEIHAEQDWPTGWNVGYNSVSWVKSKTQRLYRHCALWDGLPVSTQTWFITSIRSVFHDTLFFHLSNYTALMCSFSPASRLSPQLITHFGPRCLVVAQTLISSLMFPLKSANVPGSIGTHTCCAAFCCWKLAWVVWYIASQ